MCEQSHAPAALPLENNPGTQWIRGSVGSKAGLDVLERIKLYLWGSAVAGGGGSGVWSLRTAESKGRQNKYFKWKKKSNFLRLTNLKLVSQINENAI
jgi:hypothetical protein